MSDSRPDADALARYLADELGVTVTGVDPLAEKLNAVVRVTTEEGAAYLVRRPTPARDLPYLRDLGSEVGVLRGLADTSVPAPTPVHYCEDPSVFGGEFVVTDYLPGWTVPLGGDLPDRVRRPAARRAVAERLVDTLATVHTVDTAPFESVCPTLPVHDDLSATLARVEAGEAAPPRLRALADWLRDNAPPDAPVRLVHGDYRPSNVVFDAAGREDGTDVADEDDADAAVPTLTGVIDWETAALADPRTDLGYLLLRWRDEGDATPSLDGIDPAPGEEGSETALDALRRANERGLCPFSGDPGSPTRGELVARYEARSGVTFDHDRFFRVLAAVALAGVWLDLDERRRAAGDPATNGPWIRYVTRLAELVAVGDLPV
jgi:aminoglycoside phosphotransferase (APT) family kinase protein